MGSRSRHTRHSPCFERNTINIGFYCSYSGSVRFCKYILSANKKRFNFRYSMTVILQYPRNCIVIIKTNMHIRYRIQISLNNSSSICKLKYTRKQNPVFHVSPDIHNSAHFATPTDFWPEKQTPTMLVVLPKTINTLLMDIRLWTLLWIFGLLMDIRLSIQ